MTIITYIIMPLLALVSALFDTSFWSFQELFGATLISSFCLLLVLTTLGYRKAALVFAAASILALSAFSSLPVYMLMLTYMGIPLLIFYLRNKIFFESNFFMVVLLIFISCLVFRLSILPVNGELGAEVIQSLLFFPVINTVFSMICFVLLKKLSSYFI